MEREEGCVCARVRVRLCDMIDNLAEDEFVELVESVLGVAWTRHVGRCCSRSHVSVADLPGTGRK